VVDAMTENREILAGRGRDGKSYHTLYTSQDCVVTSLESISAAS
jgi:hypothetical protein